MTSLTSSAADAAAPLSGWLILDKPRGMGSTQAVGAVKRALREGSYAKTKVGHGGTLDPLAEGVLPIALGEATKLAGRMLDATKTYDFWVAFGTETDTLDLEGAVVARSDYFPLQIEVEPVLERFRGAIEQVPPLYSAIKVNGRRAYDIARSGESAELSVRKVFISDLYAFEMRTGNDDTAHLLLPIEFWDTSIPRAEIEIKQLRLSATVSKGTYIRSLARDISRAFGTVGHVTYLRRVKAGPFWQDRAISLDKLEEAAKGAGLEHLLLPLEAGLDDIPALSLDQTSAQAVRQGRVLSGMPQSPGLYLAKLGSVPVALVEIVDGTAKVVRGFNLPDVAE